MIFYTLHNWGNSRYWIIIISNYLVLLLEYNKRMLMITQSEQFFVEDMLFLLLILCTRNPHVFERGKTGKDTTTLPTHYVTLGWGKHPCFDLIRKAFLQLFYKAIRKTFNKSVSSGEDNLIVKGHAKVNIHFS